MNGASSRAFRTAADPVEVTGDFRLAENPHTRAEADKRVGRGAIAGSLALRADTVMGWH